MTYTYGVVGATENRVGKPVSVEDGSGKQEFKYGRQGEVTEVKRTLVIPNQAVATYITKTNYDSWNRLLNMTYPDGEVVNYTYNTGGLLSGVASAANTYVSNITYDKFEQRTYMKYGNGAETNYTYDAANRRLNNLSVNNTTATLMNNAYSYDAVSNVTKVVNSGSAIATTAGNGIGGAMTHNYQYDNLYRLTSANGTFTGYNGKTANYTLAMGYDNMHNITGKVQHITQTGVQFAGTLQAGYNLGYSYADNSQQITNIADTSYRAEGTVITPVIKTQQFSYDANGNLLSINTGTKSGDKLSTTNSRKMLWDEENRLLAVSDNGFVSNYWYDASGERTVKESGDNEGVNVNGIQSAGRSGTTNFTAYISPYLVVSNGGNYTKHIYMGGQRITSKVSNSGIFTTSPVTTIDLQANYTAQTAKIKERFDSLRVTYKGTPQSGGLVSKDTSTPTGSYFYHSDHLGSSSLITDQSGAIVQHLEYVPFGETFIDERRSTSSWTTPYLFSGKERDEETGLLYFGARYQDSKYGIWYSVDPLAEKYPNISSYVYCHDNPINMIDPDGRDDVYSRQGKNIEHNNHEIDKKQDHIVIRDQNYVKKALGSLGLGNAKFVKSMSDNIDTRIEMTTLSAEAYSNVYTNILSKTDGFNVNDLYNGKVSIIILNNDDKTFYKNNTYNNPSEEEQNASCGKYKDNGPVKLLITATIRPGKFRDYYSTVSNVKNILFDHEYFSHGIMGWGEYDSYKYQMKTPSWNNSTDFYKQLIRKNYEDVIKPR